MALTPQTATIGHPHGVIACLARPAPAASALWRSGAFVVATGIRDAAGYIRRFSAAALLEGELKRRGYPTWSAELAVFGSGGPAELFVTAETAVLVRSAADQPVALVAEVFDGVGTQPSSSGDVPARNLSDAFEAWGRSTGPRHVLLAGPRSFCAGVERAIEIVERALEQRGSPLYVRKQIVHNVHVVRRLEKRGAVFVDDLADVPEGRTVVFSAHGVSPAVREQAEVRRLKVIDGTCPLVAKVHSEARRFAQRGDSIVLIGHEGHEETEGTLGEAPDRMKLVQTADDVERLDLDGPVSYLMQTTLAVDEAAKVADALRDRFPQLNGPASDDICYATSNRQEALQAVAADVDLVLVVGSANSSNSVRLVEAAEGAGTKAYLIDDPSDIKLEWLAGCETVGLTAGASAPPDLISAVVEVLRGLGPVTVAERQVVEETVRFNLPKEVRNGD